MKVIGRGQRPQSSAAGAFQRSVGVSAEVTGAEQLWSVEVELAPVTRSPRDVVVEVPVPDGWAPDVDSQ